jgi:hypothetical protein
MASVDAAAELRRAAARAEFERKAEESAPAPTVAPVPLRPVARVDPAPAALAEAATETAQVARADAAPVAVAAVPSRYASMGLLDETDTGSMDLDAVLRRRRAAS